MVARFTQLRALACAFTVLTLSACGGGGGGGSDPQAKPSQQSNVLSVDGGDTTVPSGRYTLDTNAAEASYTLTYDVDQLEEIDPDPESVPFFSAFLFSQSHPAKFAVIFADKSRSFDGVFACRSAAWSAKEIQTLDNQLTVPVPLCPSTISVDPSTHRISFSGLKVPSATNAGKSVTISADFSWVLQPGHATITLETGSTVVPAGLFQLDGGGGSSTTLGGIDLGVTEVHTSSPVVTLYYPQGRGDKFLLTGSAITSPSRMQETYACVSRAWTAAEVQRLQADLGGTLTACPSSVSFAPATRMLTLNKATLPALQGSGNQLVLSLSVPMREPAWPATSQPVSSGI